MPTSDIVLEHLRRLSAATDALRTAIVELQAAMTRVHGGVADLHREHAHVCALIAEQSGRIDRLDARVGRIELRLQLNG